MIADALLAEVPADVRDWIGSQPFAVAFSGAARRTGKQPIAPETAARITAEGLPWPVTGVDECARAALIVRANPSPQVLRDLYRRGEVRERQAVLRSLAALPEPARFVDLAIEAFRQNVQTVFEALACDNAIVAQLPAAAFDQLVLKALFTGAPVARIVGLAQRRTDELRRMVAAYVSERRAAGRTIPNDVELIL